jgi:hypothetical protein
MVDWSLVGVIVELSHGRHKKSNENENENGRKEAQRVVIFLAACDSMHGTRLSFDL